MSKYTWQDAIGYCPAPAGSISTEEAITRARGGGEQNQQIANFRDRPGEQKVTISFGGISIQLGVTEFRSLLGEFVISELKDAEFKRFSKDLQHLVNTLISISPTTDEDVQQMLAYRAATGHAYKTDTAKLECLAALWQLRCSKMHFASVHEFKEAAKRWNCNLTNIAD